MISEKDTICAIATGTGSAGIGIVRLSGPDSIGIADRMFRGKRRLSEMNTYTAAYGQLVKVNGPSEGEALDEVIALVMRAPHTYTTEDVVELSCHGGPLVLHRVLEEALKAGARLAEPGEFTRRAYLGGRIDLSEAEAVMDVIAAESDRALEASLRQLRGSLRNAVTELREKLLYETAYIESALDDPEHYTLENYGDRIRPILEESRLRIRRLLAGEREGRLLRTGIRTAIVGRPNAGKSSILNLLLGEERAIVTEIAGTTRDTLEEKAILGDVPLVLIDTAGIRETRDVVEQIGVKRAKEALETADLILMVIDAAEALSEEDEALLRSLTGERPEAEGPEDGAELSGRNEAAPILILLNKNDLATVVSVPEIEQKLETWKSGSDTPVTRVLEISAATGEGRDSLAEAVRGLFFAGTLSDSQETYLLNARHTEALSDADEALGRVEDSLEAGVGEDFYTIDLLAAYEALGRITGETLEDDLADKIFAEFCMGK